MTCHDADSSPGRKAWCRHLMTLRTLDLFSGIGGFALGLRDISRVVGYCECDARCTEILTHNMTCGRLDTAPVYPDVRDLSAGDLMHADVELITAGSPCQDISGANPYAKGIHGPKSKLIFEVARLAAALPSVHYVILENSGAIVHKGLQDVLKAFVDIGFDYMWTVGSATEVGALHRRTRWICILRRRQRSPSAQDTRLDALLRVAATGDMVDVVEPDRMIPYTTRARSACERLGNAVVPAFVLHMVKVLVFGDDLRPYKCASHACRVVTRSGDDELTLFRTNRNTAKALDLVFEHADGTRITKQLWVTPRRSAWWVPKKLTPLTVKYLVAQVVYETQTPKPTSDTRLIVNPAFVEWLMLYPVGWAS